MITCERCGERYLAGGGDPPYGRRCHCGFDPPEPPGIVERVLELLRQLVSWLLDRILPAYLDHPER